MRSILLSNDQEALQNVYTGEVRAHLAGAAGLCGRDYSGSDLSADPAGFADVEVIFSTWGMPALREEEIARVFPSLRCIFYAAGSVQYFAHPFLRRGIRVFSAAEANAVPVAEYTAAQIILAGKGFFRCAPYHSRGDLARSDAMKDACFGNYHVNIGLLGAGAVGRRVIARLRAYDVSVFVFDPFLSDARAGELGVRKCSLEEIFRVCTVVSNHLANNEATKGLLTGALFRAMPPYATFINTGRGAQVAEPELAAVLAERPDLTAILDVTDPEPPRPDSPFYTLENCIMTPHIAGSIGGEVARMGEWMSDEFDRWAAGRPTEYEVTLPMLETMA